MEETLSTPAFTFKRFFLRSLVWNLLFTVAFGIILGWNFHVYSNTSATRATFLLNLCVLPIAWTHALLLLIFAIRRLAKKQLTPSVVFFLQFFLAATIGYLLFLELSIFGWAYAMKGH